MQTCFPEGAMATASHRLISQKKTKKKKQNHCYFSLECLSCVFLLSKIPEADFHAPTRWINEGFHCWSVFSGVSDFPKDIFTLEQKRHGAVLLHVFCVSIMIRLFLQEERIITFTHTFVKSTFSKAVPLLFTGYLHVSCAGYRVWRLLCAIAGKTIRGMSSRPTGGPLPDCVCPPERRWKSLSIL